MADLFISYATEDRSRVEMLVRSLERRGFSVWWDRHIPPGKRWSQVIEEALSEARCIVVVWSSASVASDWVQTEAEEARTRGVIVPALIDEVRIPLEFRRIQAANLIGWTGDESHPGYVELANAITAITGGPAMARAAAASAELAAPPPPSEPARIAQTLGSAHQPAEPTPLPTNIAPPPIPIPESAITSRRLAWLGLAAVPVLALGGYKLFTGNPEPTAPTQSSSASPVINDLPKPKPAPRNPARHPTNQSPVTGPEATTKPPQLFDPKAPMLVLSVKGSGNTVGGIVTDATGASIPGSVVTISSTVTGVKRQTKSNDAGVFEFKDLPAGPYTVEVHMQGFIPAKPTEVTTIDSK